MVGELTPLATGSESPSSEVAADADPTRPGTKVALVVSLVAAVAPVLWAAGRGIARDWLPTSDTGYIPIRAWDVLSRHPPLIGPPASASDGVGREIYQPGALQYDLLALPIRLFGRGPGTAITIALVNAVAIVGIAWLLRRVHGATAATVGLAGTALLVWSLGSEVLYDPWATYAPLLPLALFLVAVWCAVAGEVVALPVMVVAGSYVAQVHLSFAVVVAGLVVFTLVASVAREVGERRRGRPAEPGRRATVVRWWSAAVAVGLVCWAQPLWQQVFGSGDGNLVGLLSSSRSDLPTPGLAPALRAVGGTLAVPPMWLAPSFGSPSFEPDGDGPPLALAVAGLAAVVAAIATVGWRAHRRGSTALAAAAATVLVGLGLGFATVLRMPMTYGLTPHYLRWLWPLGLAVWLVLALGVLDVAGRRGRLPTGPIAGGAALVAVVAGLAALPTVDNGTTSPRWSVEAVHAMAPDVVAAVEGRGPVLVDVAIDWPSIYVGPPLLGELQAADVPFRAQDRITLRQTGFHHQARPGESTVRLAVRGGPPRPQAGEVVVASWSSLSDDERAELERLSGELAEVIARGGLPFRADAAATYRDVGLAEHLTAADTASADPEELLAGDVLWSAVRGLPAEYAGHSLVDDGSFPPGALDRWAELAEQRDLQQLAVYLSSEPSSA
jgi:hypothetical protein